MSMKPEFFCCIGAELKDEIAGSLKSSRIFLYRAAESQTIADMLVDGFFNEADDLRLNDLILLYCPEQSRAITYAKVSSVSGGVVKTSSVNISPEDIHIDTTGYSNISGSNLQQIINSIDAEFSKYVKKDGSSIMTGPLKFIAGSFSGAIAGGLGDGIAVYKINSSGTIQSEVASLTLTNGFVPGSTNTINIGSNALKWKNLYLAGTAYLSTINNGGNISVPTTSGTMALTSDIAIKSSEAEITSPIQNQVLKYNGSKWVNATIQDLDNVISNCITKIPQDIKITLSANKKSIYVESGAIMYYPDGFEQDGTTKKFTQVTTSVQKQVNTGGLTNVTVPIVFRYNQNSGAGVFWANTTLDKCVSGSTTPADTSEWYDTTNNIEGYVTGGTISANNRATFPIGLLTIDADGVVTNVQIFNGFGFIGNVIYALPGVKGLMPNGRNADGTAKRYLVNTSSVVTTNITAARTNWSLTMGNVGNFIGNDSYFTVDDELHIFNPAGVQIYGYVFGTFSSETGGKITSLNTKQPFRAVDYNDYQKTVEQVNTNTTNIATLETSKANTSLDNVSAGIDFVIESQLPTAENDYTWYRKYKSGWVEQGGYLPATGSGDTLQTVNLPKAMNDAHYTVTTSLTDTTAAFAPNWGLITVQQQTTTGFKTYAGSDWGKYWEVKGMAQG